jgi:hypothetical protein
MLYHKIDTIFERDPKTFKIRYDSDLGYGHKLAKTIFSIPKTWEWTEKIDGTNIYISYKDPNRNSDFYVGGRTEEAEIPKAIDCYIHDCVRLSSLKEIFGDKHVVIYGEGYGGKIQAGDKDKKRGGKYNDQERFIVFDILVKGKYWLSRENIVDVCEKLKLDVVPFVGEFSIGEATQIVRNGLTSKLADVQAEGLVGRTSVPIFDTEHERLICKLKTKDF